MNINYEDGTKHSAYLISGRHVTNWWFPSLKVMTSGKNDDLPAGIAWRGPNKVSSDVGVSWLAYNNPHPEKNVKSIEFKASEEGGKYALFGVTLSDQQRFMKPSLLSYGGPDNWAGSTCMLALVQGLAGIWDNRTRFTDARISPRWTASGTRNVSVTVKYGASDGYVSYDFDHDVKNKKISLFLTGNGSSANIRILMPKGKRAKKVLLNGEKILFKTEKIERSLYACIKTNQSKPVRMEIFY
jgi:hypothetical protein